MADFPCASTKRTSHWPAPMSREAPVRFCVSVVVAALLLTGCNANQAINPSGQADRCANDPGCDPYNPISKHRTTPGMLAVAANSRRSSRSLVAGDHVTLRLVHTRSDHRPSIARGPCAGC